MQYTYYPISQEVKAIRQIIHKMWWRIYSHTLFQKTKIDYTSVSLVWSFIKFVFIICQVNGFRNILKLRSRPFAFTSYKTFSKIEKRSGTSPPASFLAWFLKKNISIVRVYWLTKFHWLVTFNSWDIEQYVYFLFFLTRLWIMTFRN